MPPSNPLAPCSDGEALPATSAHAAVLMPTDHVGQALALTRLMRLTQVKPKAEPTTLYSKGRILGYKR